MNKGFTLVELLAVIVILAVLALIATPVVLSIIDDTKESAMLRSAEMYLSGVENAVMRENMNSGGNFRPNDCTISNGTLSCNSTTVEVEVNGEVPKEGSIVFENGKIKEVTLNYESGTIIKDSNGDLVYEGSVLIDYDATLPEPGTYDFDNKLLKSWDELLTTEVTYFNVNGDEQTSTLIVMDENGTIRTERCEKNSGYSASSGLQGNNFVLSKSVKKIDDYTFYGFNSMKTITIPSSVKVIGNRAFEDSTFDTIIYTGTLEMWNNIKFGEFWNHHVRELTIICIDGELTISD